MVKSQQTNPFIRSRSIRIYYTTASNDSIDVFSSGYLGYCWHKGYCTTIVRSLSTILYLLTKYYSTSRQRQHSDRSEMMSSVFCQSNIFPIPLLYIIIKWRFSFRQKYSSGVWQPLLTLLDRTYLRIFHSFEKFL